MENETLFERKTVPLRAKHYPPEKPNKAPRKERSDKKRNIKVKLSDGVHSFIRFGALDRDISVTALCSEIVEKALDHEFNLPKLRYPNEGKFVNVMLSIDDFKMVKGIGAEWGLTKREVAYHLIQQYISLERGGRKITDYRKEN